MATRKEQLIYKIIADTGNSISSVQDLIDRQKELKKEILNNKNINSKANKQLQAEYQRNNQALLQFNRSLRGSGTLAQGVARGMISAFKQVGATLLAAFSVRAVVGFFNRAIESAQEFEQAMAGVLAITGATADEFERLEADAKRLGETTVFTATEIAKLQVQFAKKGFNTDEIIAATEATLNLAAATQEDLVISGDVATGTLNAFGLAAQEMTRVTDVMASSFTTTALDLDSFSEAMKLVGPVAKAANVDLETMTAILGKLADANIRGSRAGTATRNLMIQMVDPASKLSKEIGFTVNSSESLIRAFEVLTEKNLDLEAAAGLVDKRVVTGLAAIGGQSEAIKELAIQYDNAAGAAKEMADIQLNTLQGQLKLTQSAANALFIEIGDKLAPTVSEFRDGLITFISSVRDNLNTIISWTRTIVKAGISFALFRLGLIVGARLTKLYTFLTKLATASQSLFGAATTRSAAAMRSLNAAVRANPFGILLSVVAAIIPFLIKFTDETEDATEAQDDFNESIITTELLLKGIIETTNRSAVASKLATNVLEAEIKGIDDKLKKLEEEEAKVASFQKKNEERVKKQVKVLTPGGDLDPNAPALSSSLRRIATLRDNVIIEDSLENLSLSEQKINREKISDSRKTLEQSRKIFQEELDLRAKTVNKGLKLTDAEISEQKKRQKESDKEEIARLKFNLLQFEDFTAERLNATIKLFEGEARIASREAGKNQQALLEQQKNDKILALKTKFSKKTRDDAKKDRDQEFKDTKQAIDEIFNLEEEVLLKRELSALKNARDTIEDKEDLEEELIRIESKFSADKLALQLGSLEAERKLLLASGDSTAEIDKKIAEARLAIFNKFLDDKDNSDELAKQKQLKRISDITNFTLEQFQRLAGLIAERRAIESENALIKEQTSFDERDEDLKRRFENNLITEKEFNRQKDALDAEHKAKSDAIKIKQFKADQKAAIASAIISTAQSISVALSNPPGPPATIPFGILAGVLGGIQIANIKKQDTPKFEKGVILDGPSHAQGGIQIYGRGGAYYGEAEGGEPILTKAVSQSKEGLRMASDLNQMFGGIRFDGPGQIYAKPKFQTGGVFTATETSRANTSELKEVMTSVLNAIQDQRVVLSIVELNEKEEELKVLLENAEF